MEHADIDRALATEEEIDTSPVFQGQVMRAVRARSAFTRRPLLDVHAVWPIVVAASVVFPMLIAQQLLPPDASWMLLTLGATWATGWFFTNQRIA